MHSVHNMIVKRFCTFEVIGFSRRSFLSKRFERFVNRHKLFGMQVTRSFCTACGIAGLFFASYPVYDLDSFVAIRRLRIDDTNIIGVIPVLHLFPLHWNVELFLDHSLKCIGFRQRYPDTSLAFNLRKFDSIDELELVSALDDVWIVSSTRNRDSQESCKNPKTH